MRRRGLCGAALLPLTNGAGVPALALVFVWGGFIAGLYAVGLAHLGSNFKGGELAAANAAFAILYAMGVLIGPSLGGIGMDLWNPHGLARRFGADFRGFGRCHRRPDRDLSAPITGLTCPPISSFSPLFERD